MDLQSVNSISSPEASSSLSLPLGEGHMKWYVVHTYSGFENKVKASLEQRIREHNLEDKFGEIVIPTEDVVDVKDGKKVVKTKRSFPGYMLLQMEMTNETWLLVRNTPKVSSFVGGKKPDPVSQKEVDALLGKVEIAQPKAPVNLNFRVGESVRVIDGVFLNFTGVVAEISEEKSTLKIMISILGRQTPVELDFGQVAPV